MITSIMIRKPISKNLWLIKMKLYFFIFKVIVFSLKLKFLFIFIIWYAWLSNITEIRDHKIKVKSLIDRALLLKKFLSIKYAVWLDLICLTSLKTKFFWSRFVGGRAVVIIISHCIKFFLRGAFLVLFNN